MNMAWGHHILCAVFVSVLLCASPLPAKAEKIFNAQSYELDNGMQIVIIPNTRAPVVTHMVWYKVGAADEPKNKSGIAHFMEHLMFKGSEGLKPGEFSEIIRGLGGNDNAFTSQDFTAYFQSIASEHLETVMKMEAGRMKSMTLPPDEVLSERKVILEERRQRTDNNPQGQFQEKILKALHGGHPYATPVIGWPHEMKELNREDAQSFSDLWYLPNNAVLVISGNVVPEEAFALAQKIYGPIPRGEIPERTRQKSIQTGHENIHMQHPAIQQPLLQKAFLMPSYHESPMESLALQILEEIIGNGSTSRLYKSLVIEQKIASNAGLSYRSDALDKAALWAQANPLPGITLERLENAIDDEFRKIVSEGISEEELSDAKSRMKNEAIYARDSLQGPAMIFGYALTTGSTIDDVEYWPNMIAQITALQIQEVVKKYLDPDNPDRARSISGFLSPQKEQTLGIQPQAGREK